MITPAPDGVPHARAEVLASASSDLRRAGFTVDGLHEHLGPVAFAALSREMTHAARWVMGHSCAPWATAVRLLSWGETVPVADAAALFAETGVEALLDCGLLRRCDDDTVAAPCSVQPYGDETHQWWLASDHTEEALGTALPPWHVLGVGGASATLASWTPRRPVQRALDLGTGCGVQALHLATHCQDVVVTDISARALAFAELNAAWAGHTWTAHQGSLFEPVAGQRFDLVVSNPPFVITPRDSSVPQFDYRDGGRRGDDLVRDVVVGMEGVLNPGGVGVFLANWEVAAGQRWDEPITAWLEQTGLDAWVMVRDSQDPAEYAALWARDGGHHERSPLFGAMVREWLQDFASRQVASIEFGVVVVQRPRTERAPFRDVARVTSAVASPMGPVIDAGLRARTWLAEHPTDLWDEVWVCADDVTEERHFRPGEPDPRVVLVRQGGGLGRSWLVSTEVAGLLGVCDGELTPGQACAGLAVLSDRDVAALRDEVYPTLCAFIADGVLLPLRGWDSVGA